MSLPVPETIPRRLRNRCSILFQPTNSVDSGWSWTVCIGCFFIHFFFNAIHGSFGVMYIGLIQRFTNSSPSGNDTDSPSGCNTTGSGGISGTTAWIGSLITTAVCVIGPLAAYLSSRFSFRSVIMMGGTILTTGTYLTTYTRQIWQTFLTFSVLSGIGTGLIYTPSLTVLPRFFSKRLPVALAITMAGIPLGPAVFSVIARLILKRYGLDRLLFAYTALGLSLILASIVLRSREKTEPEENQRSNFKQEVKEILKNKRFMVWAIVNGFYYFGYYLPIFHLVRYAECTLGISSNASGLLLTYQYIAAVCGVLGFGALANRIKNRIALQGLLMFLGAVPNFLLPLYKNYAHIAIHAVVSGVSSANIVLNVVICRDLLGSKFANLGYGIFFFISAVPSTAGPPAAGWMYDAFQNYTVPFAVGGVIIILAALMMMLSAFCFQLSDQPVADNKRKGAYAHAAIETTVRTAQTYGIAYTAMWTSKETTV